jgi:hypothetical protein
MDAGQRVVKDYGDTERVKFELWDSRGEVSEVVFCG